jgi:hypothetical protein
MVQLERKKTIIKHQMRKFLPKKKAKKSMKGNLGGWKAYITLGHHSKNSMEL